MHDDRHGFSMVEALVGMMVLASTAVLVSSSLSTSQSQIHASKTNADAAAIASQQLDWYINVPEAISVPSAVSIGQLNSLKVVSIPDTLDGANATVVPNQLSLLSPAQQDFFYDKEMVIHAATVGQNAASFGEDTRKYQVSIYERDPATGNRGPLVFRSSELSGRHDPRSRSR